MNSWKRLSKSLIVMKVLVILGITLSISTFCVSQFISNGFEQEYKKAFLGFNSHLVIMPRQEFLKTNKTIEDLGQFTYQNLDETRTAQRLNRFVNFSALVGEISKKINYDFISSLSKKLSSIEKKGIVDVAPFVTREGLVIGSGKIMGVVLKGADLDKWTASRPVKLISTSPREKNSIYVGRTLAEKLGKAQEYKFVFGSKNDKGSIQKLKVAGTFESGLYDFDSQFVMMDIADMKKLFNIPDDSSSGIEIMLDKPEKAKNIAAAFNIFTDDEFSTITWEELNKDFFEAIALEKKVFAIIMGLLIVVGSFNLITLTVLMILRRRFDVALFKSLGMKNKSIRKIFLMFGFGAGGMAAIFGLSASIAMAYLFSHVFAFPLADEIYSLNRLPVIISYSALVSAGIFALIVSLTTSFFAAGLVRRVDVCTVLQER